LNDQTVHPRLPEQRVVGRLLTKTGHDTTVYLPLHGFAQQRPVARFVIEAHSSHSILQWLVGPLNRTLRLRGVGTPLQQISTQTKPTDQTNNLREKFTALVTLQIFWHAKVTKYGKEGARHAGWGLVRDGAGETKICGFVLIP
jgi:hypothetical protein